MAGHGGRLPSVVNGQVSEQGFVLPLSSQQVHGWRSIFTTLSPFVSRTSGRTLRVYARRLLNETSENGSQPISNPPIGLGERRNTLGVWSSSNSPSSRGVNGRDSVILNEEFSSALSQENENVVINIDSNNAREPHRRSTSPSSSTSSSYESSSEENSVDTVSLNAGTTVAADVESSQQVDDEHSASLNGEPLSELLERHPELRNVLKAVWQYCIFILIIIIKVVYDKFASLLIIILLLMGFVFSNKIIKLTVSCQERRSKRLIMGHLLTLVTIPLSIYMFYRGMDSNLYYSALLFPSESRFDSLSDLLWVVVVTDLVLKLSTVFLKGVVCLLPTFLLHYQFRGNYLAMIEFSSQLYRSLAPVQPWLSYLLDDYAGIEKVFGVFLSALYMLCKGSDIIYKVKNFNNVFWKFLQNSRYGSIPSKDQLKDTGSLCPICQDDFVLPTMLQCKHIFCEQCVARWFDRERTCPMCRTKVADDPRYRDGSTSYAIQLY